MTIQTNRPFLTKIFTFSILILLTLPLFAEELDMTYNLEGNWKFTLGDNHAWASQRYSDLDWENIKVPATWEEQGFKDYNGYAWYRKSVRITEIPAQEELFLSMGYIDDVDEVYFNGELIGFSGQFPTDLKTAYNAQRTYRIPKDLISMEKPNTIAVRVYDQKGDGGIVKGDIGIYQKKAIDNLSQNLSGVWDFCLGDQFPQENGERMGVWTPIMVPNAWEEQGHEQYNGYACYQKTFSVSKELAAQELYLVIGKIDDYDQVFLNGQVIGSTGLSKDGPIDANDGEAYGKTRSYKIPPNLLSADKKNTIHVRVFDSTGYGGIYEGPIGLTPFFR